ncbi:DUF6527 family protein [Deinococcus humi]|uniref:Uncharacterized protein n=1 Tax=Deinococcus humi TaxID=662880 RepID=A0A7W8JR06_9DEIO|nr:DUF6527 family protein [Deinococcus humi]MBB5361345.1 hypothetical protein [Deinococcus humi]GGO19566.1 hypothetical protein GCM10008949_04090 [Deinococcus humi]
MNTPMIHWQGERMADWKPGLIRQEDGGTGHHYVCPCGCNRVYFAPHAVVSGSVETGDLTLTPSLFHNAPGCCGWHGWLRDGVFESVETAWHTRTW